MEQKIKIPVGGDTTIVSTETEAEQTARLVTEAEAAQKTIDDAETAKLAAEALIKPIEKTTEELATETVAADAVKLEDNSSIIIEGNDGIEVTYKLDVSGNAIKEDGTVMYTSEQLKAFEGDDTGSLGSILEISALSGIKVLDVEGKEKTYADTVEGHAQREVDIKTVGYEEGVSTAMDSFFAAHPEFESQYNYKRIHGSLEGYSEFTDYTKIVVDPTNKEQLSDLIYRAEIAKGASPERATRLVNFSKAEGTLEKDGQDSAIYLKTSQEAQLADVHATETKALNDAIKAENDYFGVGYNDKGAEIVLNVPNSVYDLVVVKGTIGDMTIPKDGMTVKDSTGTSKHFNRKQIFDYISKPVSEIGGELFTQAQLDEYKRLANKSELIATYIRNLLGNDISQLVATSKLTDKANTIRKLKAKPIQSGGGPSNGGSKKVILPINK